MGSEAVVVEWAFAVNTDEPLGVDRDPLATRVARHPGDLWSLQVGGPWLALVVDIVPRGAFYDDG